MNAAAVIAALHAAADQLADDLAAWAERDPGEPLTFQPEAMAARQAALQVIDEAVEQLRRLRREIAGGPHRGRGRPGRLTVSLRLPGTLFYEDSTRPKTCSTYDGFPQLDVGKRRENEGQPDPSCVR